MKLRVFTDLQLERHLCGELSTVELEHFDSRATEADLLRLGELKQQSIESLQEIGVHKQVTLINERLAVQTKKRTRQWYSFVPAALVSIAVLAMLVLAFDGEKTVQEPEYSTKGDALLLRVHLATASGNRLLRQGDILPKGGKIRFTVQANEPGFVAVVGIDAARFVSVYYPQLGRTGAYSPDTPRLPGAIEMDHSSGTESFFVIYSKTPFDAKSIGQRLLSEAPAAINNVRIAVRVFEKQ